MATKKQAGSTSSKNKKNGNTVKGNGKSDSVQGNRSDTEILLDARHIMQITGIIDQRELLAVLTEVKNGNFSVRMPFDQVGLSGKSVIP